MGNLPSGEAHSDSTVRYIQNCAAEIEKYLFEQLDERFLYLNE